MVTGGRETQAVLTIHQDGDTWELGEGASLHDVTHLPCRSGNQSLVKSRVASGSILMTMPSPARYQGGSPASAKEDDFPVRPGGEMPGVAGCTKQDYWVLFVVALENK